MKFVNKELSRKIYGLKAEWTDTTFCWNGATIPMYAPLEMRTSDIDAHPAYDLSYLLDKLFDNGKQQVKLTKTEEGFKATMPECFRGDGENYADAVGELIINLIEKGEM